MPFKVSFLIDTDEAKELKKVIKESRLSEYDKEVYCVTIQQSVRNYQIRESRERINTLAAKLNTSVNDKDNLVVVTCLENQIKLLKQALT